MPASIKVKVTVDKTAEVVKSVQALTGKQVMVGIPATNAYRPGETVTNAMLGYIHEFGSPAAHIPPRPFLIPGIESVKDQVVNRLQAAAKKALDGDVSAVDSALMQIGLLAQSAVQKKITDGPFVPLAPATIAARKAKGHAGIKPLIDTGALRQAVSYVIRKA